MRKSRQNTNSENYYKNRYKYVRDIILCAITVGLFGYFFGVLLPHVSLHPHGNTVLGAFAVLGVIAILELTYLLFESAKQIRPYKSLKPTTKTEPNVKDNNTDITNIKNFITPTSALTQTVNKIKSAQAQAIMNSLSILLDDDMAKFNPTPQESKVAKLILQGKTYEVIAKQLFITESTVKKHAKSLFVKADVDSRENFSKLIWDELEKLASPEK